MKILALVVISALLFTVVACSPSEPQTTNEPAAIDTPAQQEKVAAEAIDNSVAEEDESVELGEMI
jgi:hypothetical protein